MSADAISVSPLWFHTSWVLLSVSNTLLSEAPWLACWMTHRCLIWTLCKKTCHRYFAHIKRLLKDCSLFYLAFKHHMDKRMCQREKSSRITSRIGTSLPPTGVVLTRVWPCCDLDTAWINCKIESVHVLVTIIKFLWLKCKLSTACSQEITLIMIISDESMNVLESSEICTNGPSTCFYVFAMCNILYS